MVDAETWLNTDTSPELTFILTIISYKPVVIIWISDLDISWHPNSVFLIIKDLAYRRMWKHNFDKY